MLREDVRNISDHNLRRYAAQLASREIDIGHRLASRTERIAAFGHRSDPVQKRLSWTMAGIRAKRRMVEARLDPLGGDAA